MNRKMKVTFWGIVAGLLAPVMLYGQQEGAPDTTGTVNNPYFINAYNLEPVSLPKGSFSARFLLDSPHYYKWYSPKTDKPEKLSDKMVVNEINFHGLAFYGLTGTLDVFLDLPVRDLHYYSPMGARSGVGLGDMLTGINWNFLPLAKDGKNSVTTGLTLGFPTGKYKNLDTDKTALGEGSFRFNGNITGLHQWHRYNLIWSAYYEYRTNHSGWHIGDETGAYGIFQIPFNTTLGNFGVESSLFTYWKFQNTDQGHTVPNSEDYAVNLGVGGWYNFIGKFYLRFHVPFAVFQNNSWFTHYRIMIQLDYLF